MRDILLGFLEPLLWVQVACALFLMGLIWFVQIVHYPLFELVGSEQYKGYQVSHQSRTGLVVIGPMLLEIFVTLVIMYVVAMSWETSSAVLRIGSILSLIFVLGIWGSTFLLQVPAHGVLEQGWNSHAHHMLVSTNWIRTTLWSGKAAVAILMIRSYLHLQQ